MKILTSILSIILLLLIIMGPARAELGKSTTLEKNQPDNWISINRRLLRFSFPSWKSMAAETLVTVKPKAYNQTSLDTLRVMRNDPKDSTMLVLGTDDLGETKLHWEFKRGKDGTPFLETMAGMPGTIWILASDPWITLGDLRVKGFNIRVIKKQYDWKNPQSGKIETVPNVIHIEFENFDPKTPGELVYVLQGDREAKFVLNQEVGVFVFVDLSDSDERLVEQRGWKQTK